MSKLTMIMRRNVALQRMLCNSWSNSYSNNLFKLNFSSQPLFTNTNGEQPAQCAITELSKTFKSANISEPQLSAELLVGEVLGVRNLDKLQQISSNSMLNIHQAEKLKTMSQCRLANMPIQYILGYWDFRTLRLKMRPPVFIPRPETEELVSIVLTHLNSMEGQNVINVLEIGCGSGAISLSLMKEYKNNFNYLKILAIDQSASACNLTSENAAEILINQNESLSSCPQKGKLFR